LPQDTQQSIDNYVDDKMESFKQRSKKPNNNLTSSNIKKKLANERASYQEKNKITILKQKRNMTDSSESDTSDCSIMNDNDDSQDLNITEEKVLRYIGESLYQFFNPIRLKYEIDSYIAFQQAVIKKAFINNKNKQLYIITDDLPTINHLNKYRWPERSFNSGIIKFDSKPKTTFIAIRGVHQSINIDNEEIRN